MPADHPDDHHCVHGHGDDRDNHNNADHNHCDHHHDTDNPDDDHDTNNTDDTAYHSHDA